MPVDWVDVSLEPEPLEWEELLTTLADCIKFHIKPEDTGARVYPFWVYEIDIATLLGRAVPQMYATSGTSNGLVHCWTLGISEVKPILTPTGDAPAIGGIAFDWDITVDVWGLWSYDGTSNSQKTALREARLVAAAMFRNAEKMVEFIPKLRAVKNLAYTALQPTPFSDGKLYTVAQGAIHVHASEHFTN